MSYEGAWRRQALLPKVTPPADLADREHMTPPTDDQGTAAWAAPELDPIPGYVLSDAQADADGWGLNTPHDAGPVDRTPAGHDQGVADPGQAPEAVADARASAARSNDQGTVTARRWAPRAARDFTEERVTERRQMPIGAGDTSTAQLRFKATSRPENLTDSREGSEVNQWVFRKFLRKLRQPDMRPLTVGTDGAFVARDSPPLAGATQYVSPFATQASGRVRAMMTPMLRRVPRPQDEESITDGTDAASSPVEFQSWGL